MTVWQISRTYKKDHDKELFKGMWLPSTDKYTVILEGNEKMDIRIVQHVINKVPINSNNRSINNTSCTNTMQS